MGAFLALMVFMTISKKGFEIGYTGFLIQSGSMEPSIMTGDVIVSRKQDGYQKNDVITFYDHTDRVVTHRIIEIKTNENGKDEFLTKGDANQAEDIYTQPVEKVIGKVVLVIPKMGYLVAFSKTKLGMFLLILVPVVLIIYDEILNIAKEIRKPKT